MTTRNGRIKLRLDLYLPEEKTLDDLKGFLLIITILRIGEMGLDLQLQVLI